jgi:hypothetical protein
MIFNDYCVLNQDHKRILMRRISSSLTDDGAFVFDVLSDNHFDKTHEKQSCHYSASGGFWSPEAHFVFENIFKYDDDRIILEKNTVIEKNNRFTICNYLQCFTLDGISKELSDAGLDTVEYFSDISGTGYNSESTEIALICKKR